TQQILAHESGLADFVDPLAGSYVLEALTRRIEEGASKYIATIDAMGGMVAAIEQGYVQREIQSTAFRYQLEVEQKRRIIVGVNEFVSEAAEVPITKIDPRIEAEQVERVRQLRASRNAAACARSLERLGAAARTSDNLVPVILDAVKASATIGEISD